MFRCLTMGPAVARLAMNGSRPVQFRSFCSCSRAVGIRRRFTIPFLFDPPFERDGISAVGRTPAGTHRHTPMDAVMAH